MRRPSSHILTLVLLLTICFSIAAVMQPRVAAWRGDQQSANVFNLLFGEGRRLFANHFFTQADVSFHSGYYPSIFDQTKAPKDSRHMTGNDPDDEHGPECAAGEHNHGEETSTKVKPASDTTTSLHEEHGPECNDPSHGHEGSHEEDAHEKAMAFLGPPRDWIEAFGRRFMITDHTHLESGKEREMLPWLKISSELDPQNVQTYTVSAYWLRSMGKVKEAEQFLRQGQRNNPDSYEILFELGRLYSENHHDLERARNLWELALKKWSDSQEKAKEPDLIAFNDLTIHLARLEESQTNYARALGWLELAKTSSPHPEVLEAQIEELRQKTSAQSAPATNRGAL